MGNVNIQYHLSASSRDVVIAIFLLVQYEQKILKYSYVNN